MVKEKLRHLGVEETPNLLVWGGWECVRPGGPDHQLIIEFAERERPLIIWDSLVEFHDGDEQSSTETREFMRHFRYLADAGATVLALHHTGKADSAQRYRGSSDIEAAVDTAFLLTTVGTNKSRLERLRLTPFKTRFGPLPTYLLRYSDWQGFYLEGTEQQLQEAKADPLETIKEIVRAKPGLNQSQIVAEARQFHIGKGRVAELLKRRDVFREERGKGNGRFYWLVTPETDPRPADQDRRM
jgi:hypothetical protein